MTKAITWAVLIFAVIILLTTSLNNKSDETVQNDTAQQTEQTAATDSTADAALAVDLEPTYVESAIAGRWQSTIDSKAVDELQADGTMTSYYDGEEVANGTWSVYTDDTADYNPSGVFLKITTDQMTLDYAVISLDENRLQINYLERGNTLEYKRAE